MATKHNKLVRSKVLEHLKNTDTPHRFHIAGVKEYRARVEQKLCEEVQEFLFKPDDKEELADILEVIEAIKKMNNWSTQEIESIRLAKCQKMGDFFQPHVLDES